LSALATEFSTGDVEDDIKRFQIHAEHAKELWSRIAGSGLTGGIEAQMEKLKSRQYSF